MQPSVVFADHRCRRPFSSVITATGIGNAIVSLLGTDTTSVIPAMFLAYFIGMIFRVARAPAPW